MSRQSLAVYLGAGSSRTHALTNLDDDARVAALVEVDLLIVRNLANLAVGDGRLALSGGFHVRMWEEAGDGFRVGVVPDILKVLRQVNCQSTIIQWCVGVLRHDDEKMQRRRKYWDIVL